MAEEGGSGLAKAVGVGAVGILAMLGKFADDCGRAGLHAGGAADDLARVGARQADDLARVGAKPAGELTHLGSGRGAGVADDLTRAASPVALADDLSPGARSAELTDEALKAAAEEGSLTLLDTWLAGSDEEQEAPEAAPGLDPRPVRVLWTFAPLSVDSLEAYLGHSPDSRERAAHERFRDSDALVIKPVFSGLPVSKTFGLREDLKAFAGYTVSDDPTRLRLWEAAPGNSILITQLLSACLVRGQACMLLACTKLDWSSAEPCMLTARTVVEAAAKHENRHAALRGAIAARNAAKRADLVIHSAAMVAGRPRFMRSLAADAPAQR